MTILPPEDDGKSNELEIIYSWGPTKDKKSLRTTIELPLKISIKDHVAQISAVHNVPEYARQKLCEKLKKEVGIKMEHLQDEQATREIHAFLSKPKTELADCAMQLKQKFADEFASLGKTYQPSSQQDFAELFTQLLHSPKPGMAQSLLNKEASLSVEMEKIVREQDWELSRLRKQHENLMANSEKAANEGKKEEMHREAAQLGERMLSVTENYDEQISSLIAFQKKDFQNYLTALSKNPDLADANLIAPSSSSGGDSIPHVPRVEESFTIYLGAQLKTMHNLRLSALEMPELLKRSARPGAVQDSERLQMLMNLYTDSLHGAVVLVGPDPDYHRKKRTELYKACYQSAELHFPDLKEQVRDLDQELVRAAKAKEGTTETQGDGTQSQTSRQPHSLSTGDVYITRHSNLSKVHVVFHLVVDEALITKEVSSRHPCIAGLRNIARLCSKFGVTNLSLPLLLVDSMSEALTTQWCLKRAELVFKCVKGFLMEGAGLGGSSGPESEAQVQHYYTLQYILPPSLSGQVFTLISDMLPTIYHLVNPVVG